ncbi:MAG: transporter permease [Citricoccus sp.]|nr:transporter permease [Citricoccus sp. WCRC_4]
MNAAVAKLALTGSRSSLGRLTGIVGGVAVGVCLLLLLLGAAQGLSQRDERAAWLREQGQPAVTVPQEADGLTTAGPPEPIPLRAETVLMAQADEVFRDRLIQRRDIAATDGSTVQIPGVETPPEPGEYYASPALQRLIESVPGDQLGNRYGDFAGTIEAEALAGPDSLVAIVGASESELRQGVGATLVSEFTDNPYGANASEYGTLFLLGGIAVFFPTLLLISITARLGAAQRAERFATLRLIGASPRVVARIAAAEAAATSLLGGLLGVGAAVLLRPVAAQVPVNGTRLYIEDLAVGAALTAIVVVLVAASSTVVAAWRTARARIGPLGAARAKPEPVPTAWRVSPLLAGVTSMSAAVILVETGRAGYLVVELLLVGGFALTAIGIVVVGPWLTLLASRIGLARARSAAAVIAASRIHRTPVATFRSVSGLVIAVFLLSLFAGASSAVTQAEVPPARPGLLLPTSAYAYLHPGTDAADAREAAAEAGALTGVQDTAVVYAASPNGSGDPGAELYIATKDAEDLGFEEIPATPVAAFDGSFFHSWADQPVRLTDAAVDDLQELVPVALVLGTNGTPAALDRARTALNASGITSHPAVSPADAVARSSTRLVHSLSVLAYLGTFVAVSIAGISLAVATAAAIIDRKRTLALMRLMGMPLAVLRRVVTRETALPLLSVLLLSAGLGFFAAWLVITGLDDTRTITWPGPTYFATLGLSMAMALGAVIATFGALRKNTAITTTRFE